MFIKAAPYRYLALLNIAHKRANGSKKEVRIMKKMLLGFALLLVLFITPASASGSEAGRHGGHGQKTHHQGGGHR